MKGDDLKLVANYQIVEKHENNNDFFVNVPFNNKKGFNTNDKSNDSQN